jgi:F-type H+-transporting ATPase subunit delta
MDNGKISVRYARALLNASLEQHCETEVYEGLVRLTNNYSLAINAFNEALSNPMIADNDKVQLLRTAIGEPIHPSIQQFLAFLTEKKRVNKVFLIALKYQEMYRKHKGIILAKATTAAQMDDVTLEKIRDYLKTAFHCEVEMRVTVDPTLIGGFILDIEHDRMDASIAGRLNALKKELQL